MSPPSRTISAARRIRRSCGFWGCSSKYWLTERVSSGARHSAACCRYHTRPLPPGRRNPGTRDADTTRIRPLDRFRPRLQIRRRHLSGNSRAHDRDDAAAGLLLGAHAQGAADAPGAHHHGAGVRRRHADPPRRAIPAVESIGDLLAHRRPVRRQRLDRQEDTARAHDGRRTAARRHGAVRLVAQRLGAHGHFLRGARIREHLGRQDPQRSGLGHLQGLDRRSARHGLSLSASCSICCAGLHQRSKESAP